MNTAMQRPDVSSFPLDLIIGQHINRPARAELALMVEAYFRTMTSQSFRDHLGMENIPGPTNALGSRGLGQLKVLKKALAVLDDEKFVQHMTDRDIPAEAAERLFQDLDAIIYNMEAASPEAEDTLRGVWRFARDEFIRGPLTSWWKKAAGEEPTAGYKNARFVRLVRLCLNDPELSYMTVRRALFPETNQAR